MKDKYFKIIDDIIEDYTNQSHPKTLSSGIVTGRCGLLLLYYQLYNLSKKTTYLNKLHEESDRIIDSCNENYSLGYGVAGIAWTINLINTSKVFDNTDIWFEEIDMLLETEYIKQIKLNNLDYFEGASGILFYFLNRENFPTKKLDRYIILFCKCILTHNKKEDWFELKFDPKEKRIDNTINLGVPHGITGIVLLLLMAKEKRGTDCDLIICNLLNLILSFETKSPSHKLFNFPLVYRENRPDLFSSIGWCYGDLMIGYSLLKSGILLKNKTYYNRGIDILLESIYRDNHYNEKLILCHGFPSLSHIYEEIYRITKNELFKNKSIFYKNISMQIFNNKYREYQSKHNDIFFTNPSIFTGFTGFLISLIKWNTNQTNDNWLKCLLL